MENPNWLPKVSVIFLQWAVSIFRKFTKITPFSFASTVVYDLVSQISLLIAFLLPFKVILLLGSEQIPSYFPDSLKLIERNDLAMLLAAFSVAAFIIHLGTHRLSLDISAHAERVISRRAEKLALFPDQSELVTRTFHQFSNILAVTIFSVAISISLVIFYPGLLGILVATTLAGYLSVAMRARKSLVFRHWLTTQTGSFLNIAQGTIFLTAFAFIVADLIWLTRPNILVAIVSVLAIRQMISRFVAVITTTKGLTNQRAKIDALLFSETAFAFSLPERAQGYWPALKVDVRERWLRSILSELHSDPVDELYTEWLELGPPGMAAFNVDLVSNRIRSNFLVKLYRPNLSAIAHQESRLLKSSIAEQLPAPRLAIETEVQGCRCHVFERVTIPTFDKKKVSEVIDTLQITIWGLAPPRDLLSSFKRSRFVLGDRLTAELFDRLSLATNSDLERDQLAYCRNNLATIREHLSDLPLVVGGITINAQSLRLAEGGRFVIPNWGHWSLEPLGAGWPANKVQMTRLINLVSGVSENHRVSGINTKAVCLATIVFEFVRLYRQEQFQSALAIVPRINEQVDSITHEQAVLRSHSTSP